MSYCIEEIPDHEVILCQQYLNGGIDSIAFINPDQDVFDYETGSEWTTRKDAGSIKFINEIKGEFPDATINKVDNPVGCGATQIPAGMDFTFTFTDANSTATNDTFWKQANGKKFKIAWRECENGIIKVIEEFVTVNATPARVPGNNKELQMYNIVLEWSGDNDSGPTRYDEPTGIFGV